MSVKSHLANILAQNKYLTIDKMMQEALAANENSYYRSTKVLGVEGDFITAPEISQLFGEIIALWAIEKWQEMGSPQSFFLCEFGAGQGKLLNDFFRVAKLVPSFLKAITLSIYDINPHFIKLQKELLAKYRIPIDWQTNLRQLPKGPAIIIANEFFDALPIKQYLKEQDRWYERVIITGADSATYQYSQIELSENRQVKLLKQYQKASEGAIIEISPQSLELIANLSQHCRKYNSFTLIIDYGYHIQPSQRSQLQYNSTLQAIKNHTYQSVLANIGIADLTAHVDFHAFKIAAFEQGIGQLKFSQQNEFLLKYGLLFRANLLKKNISNMEAKLIDRQVERLISTEQMGALFKVLELGNMG